LKFFGVGQRVGSEEVRWAFSQHDYFLGDRASRPRGRISGTDSSLLPQLTMANAPVCDPHPHHGVVLIPSWDQHSFISLSWSELCFRFSAERKSLRMLQFFRLRASFVLSIKFQRDLFFHSGLVPKCRRRFVFLDIGPEPRHFTAEISAERFLSTISFVQSRLSQLIDPLATRLMFRPFRCLCKN
jgi:hypothetical protein